MKYYMKRHIVILPLLFLLFVFTLVGSERSEASQYCYFEKPSNYSTYKVGTKIPVHFYVGSVRTYTEFDAWGQPSKVTYNEMPATLKVYKGSEVIHTEEFTYTKGKTIETTYTPKTSGKLNVRIYCLPMSLSATEVQQQDEITITVKAKKAKEVKKIKPKLSAERTEKKKAVITCTNDSGYAMEVYRAKKKNGKYKLIKKTKTGKFTDKKLSANSTYYYKVRLYAKSGKKVYKSKWSKKIKVGKFVPEQKPVITSIKNTSKGVEIKWKYTGKVKWFCVLRDDKKDGDGGILINNDVVESGRVCYDPEAEPGKTYWFSVLAVKESNGKWTKTFGPKVKFTVPK